MSDVHDIFEVFAKAKDSMEKLPVVQEQLQSALQANTAWEDHSANLQKQIETLKQELADKADKARSLEVERDEAMFRELEAQDKLGHILRAVGSVSDHLSSAVKEVTPEPKPEPQPEPAAEPVAEATPTEPSAPVYDSHVGNVTPIMPEAAPTNVDSFPPEPTDVPQPKAYDGWWDKPHNVDWKTFLDGGGRRPQWLTDADVEKDRQSRVSTAVG